MESLKDSWVTGESLLMPGCYSIASLLEACNEGRFKVYDREKGKQLIPVTKLIPKKRVFARPTAFEIPMTGGPTYSIIGFSFQEPSHPIWKELYKQTGDCWQSAVESKGVNEWRFNLPDQLGDYDELIKLQLHEKEKYELPFEVTINGSGLGLLSHPVLSDTVQYTYPYYPDQDGVVGAFLYEPEQCVMQGTAPFLSFRKKYSERMQIWFERHIETNDIDWYIQISTRTFRAYDSHYYRIPNDNNFIDKELADYPCYQAPHESVSRTIRAAHSLKKSISEVEGNCDINPETKIYSSAKYAENLVLLRNRIMDTDYTYEHPDGLTEEEYEPFIFDESLYIYRYYYFAHNRGHNEFVKIIKSFYYKSMAPKVAAFPDEPVEHVNEVIASSSSRPTVCLAKLEISKTIREEDKKNKNIEDIREQIAYLRRKCLEKLAHDPDRTIEKEIYFELRRNGANQTTAARIIYFEQDAKEYFSDKGRYKPVHILMDGTPPKGADKILNISRSTLNKFAEDLEEKWKARGDNPDRYKANILDVLYGS